MNNLQILVCGHANAGKSSVMEIIKRALVDAGISNIAISGYMNEDQSYIAQRTASHLKDCVAGIDSVEIIEVMKDRPATLDKQRMKEVLTDPAIAATVKVANAIGDIKEEI